jgi:hypothetical protein
MRRIVRVLAVIAVAAAALATLTATPAQAVAVTYGCNPSASGWGVSAAWGNGTVLETRTCLQHNSETGDVRTRMEARVRNGGTSISSNWDFDASVDGIPMRVSVWWANGGQHKGLVNSFNDVIGASYVVKYSNWTCINWSVNASYYGFADGWRVTPSGHSRSSYKSVESQHRNDSTLNCG